MNKETPKVKSLVAMVVMTAVVIGCVFYYFWQTLDAYLIGGEGAPNLATVVVGGLILAGGTGYMVSCAVRIFLQERKRGKEIQDEKEPEV